MTWCETKRFGAAEVHPHLMFTSRRDFLKFAGAALCLPEPLPFIPRLDAKPSDLCRKLASDPLRPQYHLLPAHNWMNDPNGPIWFAGRYHMFYQYNPEGSIWGNMHWAHATSPDMIHWEHEPIALSPTPDGADRDGVFSGSAIIDKGRPAVVYTGVAPPTSDAPATLRDGVHTWRESQCLAVAEDDDLRVWKKLPQPVIPAPPPGLEVTGFRDPCLWREGNEWRLILGSGIRGKGGAVLLYSSTDLHRWTYLHPLLEGQPSDAHGLNPVDNGGMWECPDFFPLGAKHVLLISTMGKVRWKVGRYENRRFTPEKEGIVDWGQYYAAKTMLDREGNRILWGWIRETRPDADLITAGWAGVMALPRALWLNSENELQMEAAPAVKSLRFPAAVNPAEPMPSPETIRVRDLAGEIDLRVHPGKGEFAFRLYSDAGDFAKISAMRQSQGWELQVNSATAHLPGGLDSAFRLHLFLDGSVLEVFANQTAALTARIYQVPAGPLGVRLEGEVEIRSLDAWQMHPISSDRLTGSLCAS
jgi:beta-fructofuranosidase